MCSSILWVYSSVLYFQSILWHRVSKLWEYYIIIKLLSEHILEYSKNTQDVLSECTLVCYTFRVCSGIVCVSLEYIPLFSNYYQSIFQNTQRIPKMCFSILWMYSSVLYVQIILWHSVSKPWVYSIIFKLLSKYVSEYSRSTQDVL